MDNVKLQKIMSNGETRISDQYSNKNNIVLSNIRDIICLTTYNKFY